MVRGSVATLTVGPEMVVPAAAATGSALKAVAVRGGAEEAQHELRKVAVRLS